MKIQSLAVMFIILILPISIVLSTYTQNRVQTLSLQSQYDSKLNNATYDALKAYQINSFNSNTSTFTNSKMRDIKASVNTFFNSLATNFSTVGYTKDTLQNYVPAVVYTMYDGYYIYSPYTNTWDNETINTNTESQSYKNGEQIYGLKPYVYYSCRYKGSNGKGSYDVVITYSLDNYISIQGTVAGGKPVSKYGYLLSNVTSDGTKATYKGVEITAENALSENICINGKLEEYKYNKVNGTKYYNNGGQIISNISGKAIVQTNGSEYYSDNDNSAVKYYTEALEMKNFIETYLSGIKVTDAVDIDGNKYNTTNVSPYTDVGKIFDFDNKNGIEAEDSNFNQHRMDVIKYAITRNLSVAISNYNNFSSASANFQMPELRETDWEKIMDNISIISFLQGMSIGGKVYNGYSIITNTKNEDVVTENSIYIRTSDNVLHDVAENGLNVDNNSVGVFNINAERRSGEITENGIQKTNYYFPLRGTVDKPLTLSYDSIVTRNNLGNKADILANNETLAKIYYTALGRERYSLYREKLNIDIN